MLFPTAFLPGLARPRLAALLLAAALPALAGCQSRGETTGSLYPSDYRDRHPIMLTDGARVLDLFVEGPNGLVARGRQDVSDFLAEYRRYGSGALIAQVPAGHGTNPNTRRALQAVGEAAGGRLAVESYQPADPAVASPIRLTFRRLQAKVASKCGLWPHDLGVSDAGFAGRNEQYWNLGCATQSNLASQVADPVDLVRGRHQTPPDTGRRMYNFGQVRQGQDPSTDYKQQATSVSQGISQ
ncbi:CpaD family pilus assembly protein [Enterovirga sp.]|jgi:pilus assembly protein CpaD|uniref:CpaD family pilus assembly protein n=1 Tax=Enterovirga sp. TaxID=2026350 RepID=UPI00260DBAEB|nr:CpaD family pilus assembly protein [Enterovirga sp.]MDB5591294.1 pilus assembly protein CpaD [Enterovirga sp.]